MVSFKCSSVPAGWINVLSHISIQNTLSKSRPIRVLTKVVNVPKSGKEWTVRKTLCTQEREREREREGTQEITKKCVGFLWTM